MSDHAEKLAALKISCEDCHRCALGNTRTNLVFGTGSPDARLMFVGEAPGEREDATGIPFVGAAGQLLDRYLFAVGIPRDDVYIANILKCRPPKNRDPQPEEAETCASSVLPFWYVWDAFPHSGSSSPISASHARGVYGLHAVHLKCVLSTIRPRCCVIRPSVRTCWRICARSRRNTVR